MTLKLKTSLEPAGMFLGLADAKEAVARIARALRTSVRRLRNDFAASDRCMGLPSSKVTAALFRGSWVRPGCIPDGPGKARARQLRGRARGVHDSSPAQ